MITHEDHLPPKVDCHTDFIPGIGLDLSFSFFPVGQHMAVIENFLGGSGLYPDLGLWGRNTLRFVKNLPKWSTKD